MQLLTSTWTVPALTEWERPTPRSKALAATLPRPDGSQTGAVAAAADGGRARGSFSDEVE